MTIIPINPNIRHDEVIARTSRDTFVCRASQVPDGCEIIARGPDRIVLLAQLVALGQAAAYLIARQS